MEELMQRRIEVLGRVHEIRNSEERPQEDGAGLDRELAGLYPTLPMAWLTSALYATGAAFVGFLYNTGSTLYVCSDSDNKWLYAAKSTTSGAVRWSIYQDSVGNLVLNATIGGTVYYFNWRNSTGACKLYSSYDKMTASEWVQNGVFGDTFQMTPKSNDNIGCASVKNYELYNRKHIVYWTFGFEYFDEGNFSADDRLIYGAYMKEVDSLNPA